MDLKWEEPNVLRRKYPWGEIGEELRDKAGEWAMVAENVPSTYGALIKQGKLKAIGEGPWEAVMREIDTKTGRGKLYVRYMG